MRRAFLLLFFMICLFAIGGLTSFNQSQAIVLAAPGNSLKVIYLSPDGQDRANSVAFSPDGTLLAAGTSEGIYIFDTNTWQEVHFVPTASWVRSLAFSPDGKTLVTGSYDSIVRLWRVADASIFQEWRGHAGGIHCVSFSGDGQTVASASDDNTIRIWRVSDGKTVQIFNHGTEGVRTVALSPDGENVATSGYDDIIRIWRVSDGSLLRELKGHTDWVRTLVYSPDGRFLASGGFDKTARLWNADDGTLLHTLEGHESSLVSVAFSPDEKYLATTDVDTTVRLWQVADGKLVDIMAGHTDFVYSVAFSPDGKEIASGGVDNSIRIWDISDPQKFNLTSPTNEVPQDCVSCHHPRPNSQPARVVEVGCSTCHANGSLVRYFCPTFPRSGGSSAIYPTAQNNTTEVGLPSPGQNLAVTIGNYGNGEHLYSRGDVISIMPISGHVTYPAGDVTGVDVQLEVKSGNGDVEVLHTTPTPDGLYSFNLVMSPRGSEPPELASPDGWRRGECLICHDKSLQKFPALPDGDVILSITATAPTGEKAFDSRWIVFDESKTTTIPVDISLLNGQTVSNLTIQASTNLYDWRGRTFLASSDSTGLASLQVEVLSENPTTYQVSVLPTIVNGVLYQSKESTQVILPPGATSTATVRLQVQAITGTISGQVTGLVTPIQIWAISLPVGNAYIETTSLDGKFTFFNLPISQVLLVGEPQALAEQGLTLMPESIDLSQTQSAQVVLNPQPMEGTTLTGKIMDETGNALPFAWISLGSQIEQNDPVSGSYSFFGLPEGKTTATINAPGYYSREDSISLGGSSMDFSLVRRPETRLIPWGSGTIVLPSETVASVEGQTITFEQGWLWGKGESEQPLVIEWGDIQITIPSGHFALERLPANPGWFYMVDGQASFRIGGTGETITLKAGEMAYLNQGQDPVPIPYDPIVVRAISLKGELPIQPTMQPSLREQVRDRLARIGIGTAQIVTFITYFIEFLALIVLVLLAVNWVIKKNRKDKKRGEDHPD